MRDTGKNKAEEADEVKEDAPFEEGIHRHGIVLRRLPSCRSHRRRSAWRSFVKKKGGIECWNESAVFRKMQRSLKMHLMADLMPFIAAPAKICLHFISTWSECAATSSA